MMEQLRVQFRRLGGSAVRMAAGGLLIASVASGCAGEKVAPTGEPNSLTVTFDGYVCTYDGPERVLGGPIRIVLDVMDQTAHKGYFVGAVTVDEGKTREDLIAGNFETGFPHFVHEQGSVEAVQRTVQETTAVLFEGPLFLLCAVSTSDQDIQRNTDAATKTVLGPIEVEPRVKVR